MIICVVMIRSYFRHIFWISIHICDSIEMLLHIFALFRKFFVTTNFFCPNIENVPEVQQYGFMKKEKETQKGKGEYMKAFLILEDGTVFTGTSIGSTKDMISEIVFNTSMTGYLEVLTDPSYADRP